MIWIMNFLSSLNATDILIGVASIFLAWLAIHLSRKIRVKASAQLPVIPLDSVNVPFNIKVTNTNSRSIKIDKIGFEILNRKFGSFELTYDSGLLRAEKLHITEGDNTVVDFKGNEIARQLSDGIRNSFPLADPVVLKMWLYITHGKAVEIEVEALLSEKILTRIMTNAN